MVKPPSNKATIIKKRLDGGNELPGLLKAAKSKLSGSRMDTKGNIFTGNESAIVKLDVNQSPHPAYDQVRNNGFLTPATVTARKGMTQIQLSVPASSHSVPATPSGNRKQDSAFGAGNATNQPQPSVPKSNAPATKTDAAIEELRNYLVLMDKYSLHNFLIYDGRTLKETPEFQSFQRAFQYKWGAITSIIFQLEEFLTQNEVKLAIINGPQVYELAKLNLPVLKKEDLQACIANYDQVEASLESTTDVTKKQMMKFVTRIQSLVRMFLAVRRFRRKKLEIKSAIAMQSGTRLFLGRLRFNVMLSKRLLKFEEEWNQQRVKLREWWARQEQMPSIDQSATMSTNGLTFNGGVHADRSRVIVMIPSMSTQQYLRLEYENFGTFQNVSINQLYMLADPSIELVYASPFALSHYQLAYHEKFLALQSISTLPKRFVTVFPEMVEKLPSHLSLAQMLWSSSAAMKKIRYHTRRAKQAMIVPRSLGWAEKRIANYLSIPLLGPDPVMAETISSRSFLKTFFMESSVNIPIGAHDIYSVEDLMVALTRLIASNLSVVRWVIRLNYDENQESCVILDAEKLNLILSLRAEQNELMGENENLSAWYSRPVQLSVRRRLLNALKKEFLQKIRFCRKDIYGSWDIYTKLMRNYGAVVEAEPIEPIGFITIACFITPLGEVQVVGSAQRYLDENCQPQFYTFPQTLLPEPVVQGLSQSLCSRLYLQYDCIGYVTLWGSIFWDGLEHQPRLWMTDIQFGCSPLFGAMGNAAVLLSPHLTASNHMPLSLCPSVPTDRQFLYIPIVTHEPLKSTHDDTFFKLCRMRGIAYDQDHKLGTLFFLPDTVITGSLSILCIGRTRIKALEQAITTLGFVQKNYGMDKESADSRRYDNLSKMIINMRKVVRHEGMQVQAATNAATT
jgi:hypothetical protein